MNARKFYPLLNKGLELIIPGEPTCEFIEENVRAAYTNARTTVRYAVKLGKKILYSGRRREEEEIGEESLEEEVNRE